MIDSLKLALQNAYDYHDKVDLLIALSDYYKVTNPDSTLYYAGYAQQIAEESEDTKLMMRLSEKLMKTFRYFNGQKKLEAAERLILLIIVLRKQTGEDYSLIGPYVHLCVGYSKSQKYDEGIDAARKVKETSLKYIDSPDSTIKSGAIAGLGAANFWLGQIYFEIGKYSDAIRYFTECVYYTNIIGNNRTKAKSLTGLARIYVIQKNYPEAISNYEAALVLFEKAGKPAGIFRTLRNLGEIHMMQNHYIMAQSYYSRAISLHRETYFDHELHITYHMLGKLYLDMYKLSENSMYEVLPYLQFYTVGQAYRCLSDSAAWYLTKAYDLSRLHGDKLITAKILLDLAKISDEKQEFDTAISQLNEAIVITKKIDARPELFNAYQHLSAISEELGRFKDALKYYKSYVSVRDTVFNKESARQIAVIQEKYESDKKHQEIELLNKENEIKEEQLEREALIRNGVILIMGLVILTGFMVFRSQRLRKKLEKQAAVINERNRISADLHDDIGTGLSKISLLSEFVKAQVTLPETKKEATKIADTSKELLENISEIIWALNSNNDFIDNMLAYIRRYAAEYFENLPLDLKITMPNSIPRTPISGESRRNIFFTVKEALYNIVKHAQATEVNLRFSITDHALNIVIHDNGIGIPQDKLNQFGNGLRNMHERMANVNGIINIETQEGTKIKLALPLKNM